MFSTAQKAKIRRLREDENYTVPQLAAKFDVGVATIYRALAEFKAAQEPVPLVA